MLSVYWCFLRCYWFSDSVLNFTLLLFLSESSESCFSSLLLPRRQSTASPLVASSFSFPYSPGKGSDSPRCNHGVDEDEVPLREKGEASPGTVAPLLERHSGRSFDLQPGVHPEDRAPQEGRGNAHVLSVRSLKLHNSLTLLVLTIFYMQVTNKLQQLKVYLLTVWLQKRVTCNDFVSRCNYTLFNYTCIQ